VGDARAEPSLYVTTAGSTPASPGSVKVFDSATDAAITSITVGVGPGEIAIIPDGKRAYVTNFSDATVSVIDTVSNVGLGTSIPVGRGPVAIAVSADNTRAYVGNSDDGSVSVIDVTRNTIDGAPILLGNRHAPPTFESLALTPDGMHVYVPLAGGTISVIDTAARAVVDSIAVSQSPQAVAFTPDGTRAYVTSPQANAVLVIDTASRAVEASIRVAHGPSGIAVTADGMRVYVANTASNTVSIIDTNTRREVAQINLNAPAQGIAVAPSASTGSPSPTPTRFAPKSTPLPPRPTPTRTPGSCSGDCNRDGQVTVNELLTLANIGLGTADLATCLAGDANHDGQITIDEILSAVNNALNGCLRG